VARTIDTYSTHIAEMLEAVGRHKGSGFLEVLQNCNIFNDGAWREFTDKDVREDRVLELKHGQPMIFGKEHDKGIRLDGIRPEVVSLGHGISEADLLVHDETDEMLSYILSRMFWPEYPVPIGVFRRVKKPTHHQLVEGQIELVRAHKGEGVLRDLLFTSDTWEVA
jgi:2-oxoglutarate ferredoxin oxidoreductase subunit beta